MATLTTIARSLKVAVICALLNKSNAGYGVALKASKTMSLAEEGLLKFGKAVKKVVLDGRALKTCNEIVVAEVDKNGIGRRLDNGLLCAMQDIAPKYVKSMESVFGSEGSVEHNGLLYLKDGSTKPLRSLTKKEAKVAPKGKVVLKKKIILKKKKAA